MESRRALASYLRTIRSGDSPFDRHVNGDSAALTPSAQNGLALFRGKANCSADRGDFRTPTLREVARTAPYMHDGGLTSLEGVVDFYNRGAGKTRHLDKEIHPLGLSADEKRDLVAFLRSLTGVVSAAGVAPP